MYSRQEASQIRKQFWTTLGQYLAPIPSAEGGKVNWLNYKTGYRHLYFRMDANRQNASISIQITHKDPDLRLLFFEQFEVVKSFLQDIMKEEWYWEKEAMDDQGQYSSIIGTSLSHVNVFDENCWPLIIGFLKPRMVALDEFWSMVNHHFLPLKSL